MFAQRLSELCTQATTAAKLGNLRSVKGIDGKSDPSTLGIVFMAFVVALLPLDISQLALAIVGAILYAYLSQNSDQRASQKKRAAFSVSASPAPNNAATATRAYKPKAGPLGPATKPVPVLLSSAPPALQQPDVRGISVQPILAPTFHSRSWEGEIDELLLQISPTPEVERIVNDLAQTIRSLLLAVVPEMEVAGYANGNLTSSKAFGVAIPEVDIVANVSPQILFSRLHNRTRTPCNASQFDMKKLQKSALRTFTDRLVNTGNFKFRRSAFRGQEPKVTLLASASLGLFSESIPIDFSLNVVTPLYNAALLTECGKIDTRAKELIMLVKRWARDRGICHAAKGHLSPYVWGILSIYFLQVGASEEVPLLPPLEQFELSPGLLEGKKGADNTAKKPKWQSSTGPKKSAGVLFTEFVHFFETQFDWRKEAVSIRTSQRAPPSVDLPLHIIGADGSNVSEVGPSIEDPFHKTQNLGDGMNALSLARLKEELSRAEALCLRGASLSELLEPWAPPMAGLHGEDDQVAVAARKETLAPVPVPPWRRPGALAAARDASKCIA